MYKKKSMARLAVAAGLGLTLAFGGIAAVPTQVFAADSAGITVNNAKSSKLKYNVYQLIDGEIETEANGSKVLKNGKLNATYKDALVSALKTAGYDPGLSKDDSDFGAAQKVLDALTSAQNDTDKTRGLEKVANALAKALDQKGSTDANATKTVSPNANGTLSVTGITTGYYLVATDADSLAAVTDDAQAATTAMLLAVPAGGVTADAKIKVPTLEKEIKDVGATWDGDWQKLADAGLVENVPTTPTYKLTGTLPQNIAEYMKYKYTFVDVLPTGFYAVQDELSQWNVSIKASYNGKSIDLTNDFTATVTNTATATDKANVTTVKWGTNDLKALLLAGKNNVKFTEAELPNVKVVVEYTPKYDTQDLTNIYGNKSTLDKPQVNSAHLEFSNNPNSEGEGKTPDHETYLYSFNLVVNKVKENDNKGTEALKGAKFTLTDSSGNTLGKDITAGDTGTFTFTGLEAETEYILTETTVPAGYKPIDPIKFKLKVTKGTGDNANKIVKVEIDGQLTDPSGAVYKQDVNGSDADIDLTILNKPNTGIPETGAAGIAGGVVIGGMLIAVSAVQIVKNRKQDAQA